MRYSFQDREEVNDTFQKLLKSINTTEIALNDSTERLHTTQNALNDCTKLFEDLSLKIKTMID
jgi:hypothetical protein